MDITSVSLIISLENSHSFETAGTAFENIPLQSLYPTIGIDCGSSHVHVHVRTNFGHNPFLFNLEGYFKFFSEDASTLDNLHPMSVLPDVDPIKKKRQKATSEEATNECRMCGKLYRRSYDRESHMNTHNPMRNYL